MPKPNLPTKQANHKSQDQYSTILEIHIAMSINTTSSRTSRKQNQNSSRDSHMHPPWPVSSQEYFRNPESRVYLGKGICIESGKGRKRGQENPTSHGWWSQEIWEDQLGTSSTDHPGLADSENTTKDEYASSLQPHNASLHIHLEKGKQKRRKMVTSNITESRLPPTHMLAHPLATPPSNQPHTTRHPQSFCTSLSKHRRYRRQSRPNFNRPQCLLALQFKHNRGQPPELQLQTVLPLSHKDLGPRKLAKQQHINILRASEDLKELRENLILECGQIKRVWKFWTA